MRLLAQRTGTFNLAMVDGDDEGDYEEAWNDWVSLLAARGLRPADEPIRHDETTMTFRLFSLEHERIIPSLDFDISRLGALAVGGGVATFFIGTGLAHYVLGLFAVTGVVA